MLNIILVRENETTLMFHFKPALKPNKIASLAVDGADPLEDALPHLRVEERLRGQAVEHVVPRLQRLDTHGTILVKNLYCH